MNFLYVFVTKHFLDLKRFMFNFSCLNFAHSSDTFENFEELRKNLGCFKSFMKHWDDRNYLNYIFKQTFLSFKNPLTFCNK